MHTHEHEVPITLVVVLTRQDQQLLKQTEAMFDDLCNGQREEKRVGARNGGKSLLRTITSVQKTSKCDGLVYNFLQDHTLGLPKITNIQ